MTRAKARIGAVALAAVALGGCYTHTYDVNGGAPRAAVVHEDWRNHWFWGLLSPNHVLDVTDACPTGAWTIENEVTFLNGLVSALTSGIYSPTTVRIRCENGAEQGDAGAEDGDAASDEGAREPTSGGP